MKSKNLLTNAAMLVVFLTVSTAGFSQDLSGWVQIRLDSNNFSGKARLCVTGGLDSNQVVKSAYHLWLNTTTAGEIEPGFVCIEIAFADKKYPRLIFGRTLDPLAYQFPGPHALTTINYPAAFLSKPLATGVIVKHQLAGFGLIVGVSNGSGNLQDDNKELDFTGRATHTIGNFCLGMVYRDGDQPNGNRKIYGADITWISGGLRLNFGQNTKNHTTLQTARWLLATYELNNYVQMVGMLEQLENKNGWSFGFNFNPEKSLIFRTHFFKSPTSQRSTFGLLVQKCF